GRLGGSEALDDPVFGDAGAGEMLARDGDVFGGDAHEAAVARAEIGGDIGQVVHPGDVDPGVGDGDHHIGGAEPELARHGHRLRPVLAGFVDEVEPGDPEIEIAANELAVYLGGVIIAHLHVGHAYDRT